MNEPMKPLISRKFTSSSSSKTYKTVIFETFATCECLGFLHRKKCRHVTELKQELIDSQKKCKKDLRKT